MSITRQLIKHVRDLAEEQPDYVYENDRCVYQDCGQPSCIIGQAARRAGVPVSTLEAWDRSGVNGAKEVLATLGVSGAAVEWLQRVQDRQDVAYPWGDAVTNADNNVVLFNEWAYL